MVIIECENMKSSDLVVTSPFIKKFDSSQSKKISDKAGKFT